jgi:hypothetical protein
MLAVVEFGRPKVWFAVEFMLALVEFAVVKGA